MADPKTQDDQTRPGTEVAVHKSEPIFERPIDRTRQILPATSEQAVAFAQLMAKAESAVPAIFRGKVGICLGVLFDSMQLGFNPFAMARSAYDVGGTLGYEAKVHAAALHQSGYLVGRLRPTYSGSIKGTHKVPTKTGQRDVPAGDLVCTISGTIVGEREPLEWSSPELGQITTKNSPLWVADPRLQLYYYTVRAWGRVYLPEVMLGAMSNDEIEDHPDLREVSPRPTLLERVKSRREEGEPALPPAAEPQEAPEEEEKPTPRRSRKKKAAAPEPEPIDAEVEAVEPEPEPEAEPEPELEPENVEEETEAAEPEEEATSEAEPEPEPDQKNVEFKEATEALADLETHLGDFNTIAAVDEYFEIWKTLCDNSFKASIAYQVKDTGQGMVTRRRLAIRKADAAKAKK